MSRSFDSPISADLKEPTLLGYALESVRELNEHCVTALTRQAQVGSAIQPTLFGKLKATWAQTTPKGARFAAAVPFLLADMGFGHPQLWETLSVHRGNAGPALGVQAFFTETQARVLARGMLMLARTIARHHARHAGPLLGLDPRVSRLVAQLSLTQVEHLADHHYGQVKPRWENRPFIWGHLLQAAIAEDRDQLARFGLYGVQLLAGDLTAER
jgi:hypothetical protein